MTKGRAVLPLVAALLLAGCSLLTTAPGPHPTAPAAGDLAHRQVIQTGNGSVTFLPASPHEAVVGAEYAYSMPMCGTLGPIDVDGSFWDATGDGGGLDGQLGVFRLVTPSNAVFAAKDGRSVSLTRHDGPKTFSICS